MLNDVTLMDFEVGPQIVQLRDKDTVVYTHWRRKSRSRVLLVEVQGAASRGPMWRRESKPLGTKLKPKFIEFGAFIDPSGQNQLYHTPLLFKI